MKPNQHYEAFDKLVGGKQNEDLPYVAFGRTVEGENIDGIRTMAEQEDRWGRPCKIDSHIPTDQGDECRCGYFKQKSIL